MAIDIRNDVFLRSPETLVRVVVGIVAHLIPKDTTRATRILRQTNLCVLEQYRQYESLGEVPVGTSHKFALAAKIAELPN